ncbi:hypothetical protein Tco_0177854 [Tanacetum coccineum]
MFDEYFNGDNQVVSRSLVITDNHQQHDTSLQLNVQPVSEPSTSTTTVNAEKNNNNQVGDAHFDDDEFISLFGTPIFEAQNVDPLNMHTFYQRYPSKYHPSEQVLRNPSKPVHTRRQLDTDTEMWEMKFFLGLKIHKFPQGIFINQCKYALEILKKHGMDKCDSIGTPMATPPKLDADLSGTPIDQTKYRSMTGSLMYLTTSRLDLVYATCCHDTCKSISGGIQFLGDKLISWSSKKQDCTTMSTAEAEYVSLSASCAQVLWMRTQLIDYGFQFNKIPMYCDSKAATTISCNPVQHSRTKHIVIRYHFIKEHVERGIVELYFEVDINKKTENQAKMTKLSMEWKRLCKIKAKVQKCQSQSQYRRISSQTGAGTEEYYWMQS